MTDLSSHSFVRTLLIYCICVPLAVFLGYLIAQDLSYDTLIPLALVLFALMIPLFLRWHHLWLIASWNLGAVVAFVPGRPYLWLAMAWISLAISVVQYIIHPRLKFLRAPTVTRPLLFLALVVLVTAKLRGGIGLGAFGSEMMGGKKYIFLLSGIVAYLALISQPISPKHTRLCIAVFFLGSLTCLIAELPAIVGPSFYFIFMVFPVSASGAKAAIDSGAEVGRLEGFAAAGAAVLYWMMCRYGLRDLLSLRRTGHLLIAIAFGVLTLFGGFRSAFASMGVTFAVLFYLEGLIRSRMVPFLVIVALLGGTVVVSFSDRMPLAIQRSISFLPLKVDPFVKVSAQESTDWRIRMWKDMLPEVPPNLLLGKGYGLNAKELATFQLGNDSLAGSEYAGDYHNGPLSVIIPFGIPGAFAFLWFLYASLRALYANYKFGNPAYINVNRFLFAFFISKIFAFFVLFGALNGDLVIFAGLVGLSISLNGGVLKAAVVPRPKLRLQAFRFRPPAGRPAGALSRAAAPTSSSVQ